MLVLCVQYIFPNPVQIFSFRSLCFLPNGRKDIWFVFYLSTLYTNSEKFNRQNLSILILIGIELGILMSNLIHLFDHYIVIIAMLNSSTQMLLFHYTKGLIE